MLKSFIDHRLVISIIGCAKIVHGIVRLLLSAQLILDCMNFALIIDKSRIMFRLWHLSEITSLAEAHRNLPIVSLHVSMERLCLLLGLAVDSLEYFFEAIVDGIYVIGVSILDRQGFLESCNAGRLSKFLLVTNFAKMSRASLA